MPINYAVLASLAAFSTCSAAMKTPEYWGDFFLDKYAAEREQAITEIEPGPAPIAEPRTVLLITGVTIPAEWFDPIVARLERDGFRPVVYEPPALLSGDLFENSEALAAVVDRVRAETGEDKIDILAECTGGLIARHYIQSLGGDQYVNRMVTFISPQHGLPKAALAASIASWPALRDLTPGSAFLEAVNSAPLPDNVAVTSIYTCTDEYIQPYKTSIIPGATNINVCPGTFVGHFQFFYDPELYLLMHGALVAPLPAGDGADDDKADSDDGAVTLDDGGCSTSTSSTGGLLVLGAMLALRRRRQRRV
jgi:triacylglycerol lipase